MRPCDLCYLFISDCDMEFNKKECVTFRVTCDELPEELLSFLVKCRLLLLVREVGSKTHKTHYQGLARMEPVQFKRMFAPLVKEHLGSGNKIWSSKPLDNFSGWLRYLCKGESKDDQPDVRYNEGYDISALHSAYWVENTRVKTCKTLKVKDGKPTSTILEECWAEIQKDVGESVSAIEIGGLVYAWYVRHRKRIQPFAMSTMALTYVAWSNDRIQGPDRVSDKEMFMRMCPNVGF